MSYEEGAELYSRIMAPILASARRPLLEAPIFKEIGIALDIGTGPGHLLQELRDFWPNSLIVGIDLAPGMLALVPDGFCWLV